MRSTGGAGDVELGTVKHVNMVALNGDGMNADIKAAFEERKANYANLRYDASVKDVGCGEVACSIITVLFSLADASRQLLIHLTDATHCGDPSSIKSNPSYLEARFVTIALRKVTITLRGLVVLILVIYD
jgi:hypothetical protein